MNTSLPQATAPFAGKTGRLVPESEGAPVPQVKAPTDAPNILVIILDDVGFGSFGTFGGPVPTPGLDLVAQKVCVTTASTPLHCVRPLALRY